jgi:hypothetical protein
MNHNLPLLLRRPLILASAIGAFAVPAFNENDNIARAATVSPAEEPALSYGSGVNRNPQIVRNELPEFPPKTTPQPIPAPETPLKPSPSSIDPSKTRPLTEGSTKELKKFKLYDRGSKTALSREKTLGKKCGLVLITNFSHPKPDKKQYGVLSKKTVNKDHLRYSVKVNKTKATFCGAVALRFDGKTFFPKVPFTDTETAGSQESIRQLTVYLRKK